MSFASAAPRTLIIHDDRPKTRADYADYTTSAIWRLIAKNQIIQDDPDSEDNYMDATFALQELHAALLARRR